VGLPAAKITSAGTVRAGRYAVPVTQLSHIMELPGMNLAGKAGDGSNPAFCRVAATLTPTPDSNIKIEVWLPLSRWNGKFLAVGNFGWAGQLMYSGMLTGLEQGYATVSTDTGHDASTPAGEGGRFALGHRERLIDYAYRADHLMTVDAKTVIEAFYGKRPARSYWIGCSLGGLEGLIEAKRYPKDFDGIVAGAPPNPIVPFNAEQIWPGWLTYEHPELKMPASKFVMVSNAVIEACGSAVGRIQGFVDEPDRCGFQLSHLRCKTAERPACLTSNQIRLLKLLYRGPVDPRTGQVIFPGPALGSEAGIADSAQGKPFPVALDMFDVALRNPNWDWRTMNWDTDVRAAIAAIGPLMHVDANLQPFFARGGKLLMYIGWNDGHNPEQLIAYYTSLTRAAHDTARASSRLFTIPGMAHCYGGAGCDTFDKLGVIDAWVDRGQSPERVVAVRVSAGKVVRSRPLCAYPAVARYTGSGNAANAANFACASNRAIGRGNGH
jgi:feruloyl esterase